MGADFILLTGTRFLNTQIYLCSRPFEVLENKDAFSAGRFSNNVFLKNYICVYEFEYSYYHIFSWFSNIINFLNDN